MDASEILGSRYGSATTDPLGREGPGWHKGGSGLPVLKKDRWVYDSRTKETKPLPGADVSADLAAFEAAKAKDQLGKRTSSRVPRWHFRAVADDGTVLLDVIVIGETELLSEFADLESRPCFGASIAVPA